MISVVVPFRDECENIEPLVEKVLAGLEDSEFEMICVDDGSVDGSREVLQSVSERFPPVRLVRHEKSLGQSAAIVSGVRAAQGVWIVTLDGDGQNDPTDIPALFEARDRTTPAPALVTGWRRRRNDPWVKRVSSKLANLAYRRILGDDTPDVGCGLKLFRRESFLELPHFDHMHRFLPVLVRMQGGHVVSVEVHHLERRTGRSKYGIHDRLWIGLVDLLGVHWLQKRAFRSQGSPAQQSHPPSSSAVDEGVTTVLRSP